MKNVQKSSQIQVDLDNIINDINNYSLQVGVINPIFKEYMVSPVNYTCSEAGFLRLVSWLYTQYFEAGKNPVDYLINKVNLYSQDRYLAAIKHKELIHALRTYFQHSLLSESKTDDNTIQISKIWLDGVSGTTNNFDYSHWELCLKELHTSCMEFFNTIKFCLTKIVEDEFHEDLIFDLNSIEKRTHTLQEFEIIVSAVQFDIGYEKLNVYRFCKQHRNKWNNELALLNPPINFEYEARKLIERDMEPVTLLPITGTDIMEKFALQPGFEIGRLLKKARRIYDDEHKNADELLAEIGKIIVQE